MSQKYTYQYESTENNHPYSTSSTESSLSNLSIQETNKQYGQTYQGPLRLFDVGLRHRYFSPKSKSRIDSFEDINRLCSGDRSDPCMNDQCSNVSCAYVPYDPCDNICRAYSYDSCTYDPCTKCSCGYVSHDPCQNYDEKLIDEKSYQPSSSQCLNSATSLSNKTGDVLSLSKITKTSKPMLSSSRMSNSEPFSSASLIKHSEPKLSSPPLSYKHSFKDGYEIPLLTSSPSKVFSSPKVTPKPSVHFRSSFENKDQTKQLASKNSNNFLSPKVSFCPSATFNSPLKYKDESPQLATGPSKVSSSQKVSSHPSVNFKPSLKLGYETQQLSSAPCKVSAVNSSPQVSPCASFYSATSTQSEQKLSHPLSKLKTSLKNEDEFPQLSPKTSKLVSSPRVTSCPSVNLKPSLKIRSETPQLASSPCRCGASRCDPCMCVPCKCDPSRCDPCRYNPCKCEPCRCDPCVTAPCCDDPCTIIGRSYRYGPCTYDPCHRYPCGYCDPCQYYCDKYSGNNTLTPSRFSYSNNIQPCLTKGRGEVRKSPPCSSYINRGVQKQCCSAPCESLTLCNDNIDSPQESCKTSYCRSCLRSFPSSPPSPIRSASPSCQPSPIVQTFPSSQSKNWIKAVTSASYWNNKAENSSLLGKIKSSLKKISTVFSTQVTPSASNTLNSKCKTSSSCLIRSPLQSIPISPIRSKSLQCSAPCTSSPGLCAPSGPTSPCRSATSLDLQCQSRQRSDLLGDQIFEPFPPNTLISETSLENKTKYFSPLPNIRNPMENSSKHVSSKVSPSPSFYSEAFNKQSDPKLSSPPKNRHENPQIDVNPRTVYSSNKVTSSPSVDFRSPLKYRNEIPQLVTSKPTLLSSQVSPSESFYSGAFTKQPESNVYSHPLSLKTSFKNKEENPQLDPSYKHSKLASKLIDVFSSPKLNSSPSVNFKSPIEYTDEIPKFDSKLSKLFEVTPSSSVDFKSSFQKGDGISQYASKLLKVLSSHKVTPSPSVDNVSSFTIRDENPELVSEPSDVFLSRKEASRPSLKLRSPFKTPQYDSDLGKVYSPFSVPSPVLSTERPISRQVSCQSYSFSGRIRHVLKIFFKVLSYTLLALLFALLMSELIYYHFGRCPKR